jgi:homoserine kinase
VANLGVAFDIVGLALAEPGDTVTAERTDRPGVHIARITGDGGRLPLDAVKNTAGAAAATVLRLLGARGLAPADAGLQLAITKGLPLASGLGSSAASAVAGAAAANAAFGGPLEAADLLEAALDGEELVSGRHADNVAPALFGGVVLSYGIAYAQMRPLPVPAQVYLALVTPAVEVPTALARAALPREVSLKVLVAQTGGVARLIDALYRDDVEALAAAMEADGVVEPARAHLMPHLAELRTAAKRAGALALVISGAGPTLLAVCAAEQTAQAAAAAMHDAYRERGLDARAFTTRIAPHGVRLVAPPAP